MNVLHYMILIVIVKPGSFVCLYGVVECSMPLRVHQKKETPNQSLNLRDLTLSNIIPTSFKPETQMGFSSVGPWGILSVANEGVCG